MQKIAQFQTALKDLLGLDLIAFTTGSESGQGDGGFRGNSADETARSVSPGEEFRVRVHASQATGDAHLAKTWLESRERRSRGSRASRQRSAGSGRQSTDAIFAVQRAGGCRSRPQPFFTRPTIEQPYYDISNQAWRERSFAPYPLAAWAEFTFDGVPIRIGQVVQTLQRVTGPGGIYEPLVVTPAIGVERRARGAHSAARRLAASGERHRSCAGAQPEGTVDSEAARGLALRSGAKRNFS